MSWFKTSFKRLDICLEYGVNTMGLSYAHVEVITQEQNYTSTCSVFGR